VGLCRRIRENTDGAYRYLLLITSKGRQEDMLAGLEAGADDYLVKPVAIAELRARVQTGKRILDLQTEIHEAQETLRVQATRDELTGLWNRRAIVEALEREIPRARRGRSSTAVVLGDLDRFKVINDTHGHAAGDAVLRAVAQRIADEVRAYDSVGRYGGEEFLLVLPGCELPGAEILVQRICGAVSAVPVSYGGIHLPTSISLGLAICDTACCSREQMISRADEALYRAKAGGRDGWKNAEHPYVAPPMPEN
jgi:two-component system cell cycle response regulator